MEIKKILEVAIKAADKKRAHDIVTLDLQGISPIADYLVVLEGNTQRQVSSITQEIIDAESTIGVQVKRVEGDRDSKWVLLDFGDVIINIFRDDERDFYQLEKFWNQAPKVDIAEWIEQD